MPLTPITKTFDQLISLYQTIGSLCSGLPFARLLPGQDKILGGSLFADGPEVVRRVARGLSDHAERFPDIPAAGQQLLDTQRSADGWQYLGNLFLYLGGQCHKTALVHQSEAIQESMQILKHVQTEMDGPYGRVDPDQHGLRKLALVEAYALVIRYYGGLKKIKEKKKKQRKQAQDKARQQAGLPPEPQKPPKSPRQRKADKEKRARGKEAMARNFREVAQTWEGQRPGDLAGPAAGPKFRPGGRCPPEVSP